MIPLWSALLMALVAAGAAAMLVRTLASHRRQLDAQQWSSERQLLEQQLATATEKLEAQQRGADRLREQMRSEFENLANRIFDAKQQQFREQSKQTLDMTMQPLRQQIDGFRKRIEEIHSGDTADRNRLKGQIDELQKQAQRIGQDAINLANALKGESKTQGNWGELVLERILEESGLVNGREYETQVSLKDEEGSRRNPDVVVHLPEGKDIVIDAKVSLNAYERYCSAADEAEREAALKEHIASLRSHIRGLSRKSYEGLEGLRTLDFVLMFVPIEPAFLLALEHDTPLFRDAYDNNIILVCPSTLLATLRTVQSIWRYEKQSRHALEIADKAGRLHDQFVLFVESLDDIGRHLERTRSSYEQARNRLADGRGNLVRRSDELRQLGAKAQKQLPESVRDAVDDDSPSAEGEVNDG